MTIRFHCPICRQPITWEDNRFRPFCSERCRTIDLGSWAAGCYRIPSHPLTIETDPADKSEPEEDRDQARQSIGG